MDFITGNTQIKENWSALNSGISIPNWSNAETIGALINSSSFYNLFNKKIPFKILSLGIIDEIKCKERKIIFKDIIVNDNNSMVKVNNVDINCYINNDLCTHLKIKRNDYNNNVIHLIENNLNITVYLNNDDSKYNILLVINKDGYFNIEKIKIANSFDDCEFKYEIIPNNTDFDINLEKHKISKTLNLLRSKDTLLGNTQWAEVFDTYNQDYINCSIIKNWVDNKEYLVKESLLNGKYNLDINFGVKNKDYRFISEFRDVKDREEITFNGYFYSNNDNNTFTISTKKIKKEDLYQYPENTSKELFKKLDITGFKLSIDPVTYRIFLDGKKREGHGETYKETELVEINTHYFLDDTSEYYTDTQIVPSSKMQAVTTHKAYHCYGLTEFKTISKGYKYISIDDLNGCNLLTVKSKLLDKAKRDDCVFAVALLYPLKNYKAYLSIAKNQILYVPPTLNKTKDKVGSYSYYSITDSSTGFTYYYLSDSDGKIVLKKADELKSSNLSSNTNLFEWLLDKNIELFDKYTTFVDDEVRYYNYKNGNKIEINKNSNKIISFYVDSENVENILFENLKQPIDFNNNIDAKNRDDVPDYIEGVQVYKKIRINQTKYYRIVLLKDNDKTSSISFTKDMCIYNPIIYDANVIKPEEEGKELNTICYDFRAPAFKLNYKELHPKEYINGNSLDKTYLPKPFYEIIN